MARQKRVDDNDRAVGLRVKQARVARGLTQSNLASLLGCAYQQVHKYERGINRISAGRLIAIARELSVAPADLLGDAGPVLERLHHAVELMRLFDGLSLPQRKALTQMARVMVGETAPEAA
jgi:transcriptional regulator with XRE-family HTH domain